MAQKFNPKHPSNIAGRKNLIQEKIKDSKIEL